MASLAKRAIVASTCALAVLTGTATAAFAADQGAEVDRFRIIGAAVDGDGVDIPIRYGQDTKPKFGISHSREKHGVMNVDAVRKAVELGSKDTNRGQQNPTYTIQAHNTTNPNQTETFIVGTYTGKSLKPIGNTPDNRPVGMITAYCKGKVKCPSWVNRPGKSMLTNPHTDKSVVLR